MIAWYVFAYITKRCKHLKAFTFTVSGMVIGFLVSIAAEIALVVVGMRGTIFDRSRRKSLPYLVYLDTFGHVIQLAFSSKTTFYFIFSVFLFS